MYSHYSSHYSTELSVSEPWKSSAEISVPSNRWGASCLLSLLWQECLVSVSSHLASPLLCILDSPLPPETEVCPRLWLLSAPCWGHWWPGGRWGNTCWMNTARRAGLLYFTGERCSFHSGCHQQVGRFEPADQCPWASPHEQVCHSALLIFLLLLKLLLLLTLPHALLSAPTALHVHLHCA